MLILFINALCYCKALNNDGKKWLLLDVNPKIRLLDVQKFQRPTNFKHVFQQNLLSNLVIELLIFFVIKDILYLVSLDWCFQKKYCLWTPFLIKYSECNKNIRAGNWPFSSEFLFIPKNTSLCWFWPFWQKFYISNLWHCSKKRCDASFENAFLKSFLLITKCHLSLWGKDF